MVRINTNMPELMARHREGIPQKDISLAKKRPAKRAPAPDAKSPVHVFESIKSRIRSHNQALYNLQQEITSCQASEGAMGKIEPIMHRVRELLLSALGCSEGSPEQLQVRKDISKLLVEVDRIVAKARFSCGKPAQKGGPALPDTEALGLREIAIDSDRDVERSLKLVDEAIDAIGAHKSGAGKLAGELERDLQELLVGRENLGASESLIRDAGTASRSLDRAGEQLRMNGGHRGLDVLSKSHFDHREVLNLLYDIERE